jgi:hypothetical protein
MRSHAGAWERGCVRRKLASFWALTAERSIHVKQAGRAVLLSHVRRLATAPETQVQTDAQNPIVTSSPSNSGVSKANKRRPGGASWKRIAT